MNCAQAGEMLVDLVYGELGPSPREELLAHLESCPACQAEYQKLQRARRVLSQYAAGEPAARPAALPIHPAVRGRKPFVRPAYRLAFTGLAAAAVVLVAVLVLFLFEKVPSNNLAYAQGIQITRQNVSLTIMSEPEGQPIVPYPQLRRASQQYAYRGWQGMALVRDQRLIANMPQGQARVSFTDVPMQILPDSVRLRSLDDGENLKILEQNYQYDLASAQALLKRYIDQKIAINLKGEGGKAPPAVSGRLMSFDEQNLVVDVGSSEKDGSRPQTISRRQVQSIVLDKMPEGLLTRPTLLWQLDNAAAKDRQQFEVAYMTRGLSWRADYILKLRPAGGPGGASADEATALKALSSASAPAIVDTADLVGYATVTNLSGVTFENANLKLMAGDVHLVPEEKKTDLYFGERRLGYDKAGKGGFEEKSFFEYHLYTLGRQTTLGDAQVKQIELVRGEGLKLTRAYVFDPSVNATAARVVSEFKNTKDNGLGKPIPKGVVSLYAPDPDGQDQFVSKVKIDHTPVDEKVRLPWGFAFDLAGQFKQVVYAPDRDSKFTYQIRNHKPYAVTVTVVAHVPNTTSTLSVTQGNKKLPWHLRQVGWAEFDLTVAANASANADVTFRYGKSGGGLSSPYDKDGGSQGAPLEPIDQPGGMDIEE